MIFPFARVVSRTAARLSHIRRPTSFTARAACRGSLWLATMLATMLASSQAGESVVAEVSEPTEHGVDQERIEFTRVHVPAGRLSDVDLGTTRYVPMSAREFEEGIARLSGRGWNTRRDIFQPALQTLAEAARYDVALAEDGSLVGTVSFDIGAAVDASEGNRASRIGVAREMPLGAMEVRSGSIRTAAGMGEAVVFGRRDGTVAVRTPEAGTYSLDIRCVALPGADERPRFSLPLVPALASSIVIRLPVGTEPVVAGDLRARPVDEPQPPVGVDAPGLQRSAQVPWRIDTGPRETLELSWVAGDAPSPRLWMWTAVGIHGRQWSLHVHVRPTTPWLHPTIRLEKDPAVLVTQIAVGEPRNRLDDVSWNVIEGGTTVSIDLPAGCVDTLAPIVIEAVAPVSAAAAPLPRLRPSLETWAGGGITVGIAPSLTLASIQLEHCMVVAPEVAARWPLPASAQAIAGEAASLHRLQGQGHGEEEQGWNERGDAASGVGPARLFVEEEAPGASVTLSLAPRIADLDVARVTTVDLSPVVVVGRTACDVRVRRGEAFDLQARITPGWFIDSVEAIAVTTPAELADSPRRIGVDEPAAAVDWKVIRDARGDALRIGLISGVTPARGLGLRITGHRAGIPLGEEFSTADVDMVRLEGESERAAVVDLRTSPETTVELPADQASSQERPTSASPAQADFHAVGTDGRVAALMEDGATRARLWAGFRAPSRTARLVRRRPPLDARTQVRLTVRDDRLTEAFTFECQPSAADLDSIVVQFSSPVDEALEWSLLPPAIGGVSARRLDSSDRRPGTGGNAGGERWLVELNPPAREPVSIRASRTMSFTRATPVLLAWVDGAISSIGHCIVRNVGRVPPTIDNRRLREVPPEPTASVSGPATLAEFAFSPEDAFDSSEVAAAELRPGGGDGRAWAWREITSSWCFASGTTEYESRFDIENRGRTSLALSLPPGRRVQGILLDGVRLPLGERVAAGGQVPVELPAGRPRVTLVVRTSSAADGVRGGPWSAWLVDASPAKLDIPVLQRMWRLLLPPALDIALMRGVDRVDREAEKRDWFTRLFAGRWKYGPAAVRSSENEDDATGFRSVLLVPSGDAAREAAVVIVHARVVVAATLLMGLVAGIATLLAARASLRGALLLCLLVGVATLWASAPFDGIARAAWWACLVSLGLKAAGWPATAKAGGLVPGGGSEAAMVLLLIASSLTLSSAKAADEGGDAATVASSTGSAEPPPLRVFVTPIDGGASGDRAGDATVLVPEALFRAIVRGEDGEDAAAVRVLAVRVAAAAPPDGDRRWTAWRMEVDVDADAGGILPLDQAASGARVVPGSLRIDGAAAMLLGGGDAGELRLIVPDAGRHTVSVDVEASDRRSGEVDVAAISIPWAPEASLRVPRSAATNGLVCERATTGGEFVAAFRRSDDVGGDVFDVSRSAQVRLARPVKPEFVLASTPSAAVSRNDIFWNLDECRVTGVFDIGAGDTIIRSCVVRADEGLEWIPPADQEGKPSADAVDGVSIRPLGGRRFLVERRRPERGRCRFEMAFRMPLADAVGVFDVPGAWVEDALVDSRSVRFVASPSLAVRIDLPPGLVHTDVPESESSFDTRFWRGDVSRPVTVDSVAGRFAPSRTSPVGEALVPRARLCAERRRQEIRVLQREAVVLGDDQVRFSLDARLDASSTAMVTIPLEVPAGCVVDRVELFEDDLLQPETAERGAIDLRWTRPGDTSVNIVVQRPRAGRFRLEVDARIPGRVPTRGPLPGLRVDLADGVRSLVEWSTEDGLVASVDAAPNATSPGGETDRAARVGRLERVGGGNPPSYRLEAAPVREPSSEMESAAGATPRERSATAEGRVELADIRLAVDERGRAWGVAAFELVPTESVVRLQLPRSWRLFDALVDGRSVDCVVPATPAADTVWEVPMLDASRPRSIVALFVGDLFVGDVGRRLLDGEPLALVAPTILGLPCRQVLWTLQVPADIALRVAAPARLVEADFVLAQRRSAWLRMEADVEQAIGRSAGWGQDRMRTFMASRGDGMPTADQVWSHASTTPDSPLPQSSATFFILGGEGEQNGDQNGNGGQLTIRAVRRRDPTTRGRAIATLSLLACGGLAWIAARRRWSPPSAVKRLMPLLAMLAGLAWSASFVPAWPGFLVAAGAAAAVVRTWRSRPRALVERPAPLDNVDIGQATTIYRPQR